MKFQYITVVIFSALVLAACNKNSEPQQESSTLLKFVEFQKDVEPYPTRLIVTPDYLRFDDGEGAKDFIMFDRNKKLIYSVNSEEQTVMSMRYKETDVTPPFELKLRHKTLDDMQEAPVIAGKKPAHYQFSVNGKPCYDVVSIKGLLPDVVDALQSFGNILASDSKLTFNTIPADMHDACDMAMTTFASGAHFELGFPIQEWSIKGAGRSLVDFEENYKADPLLFVLPADYHQYALQDYREGKVKMRE